MLAFIGVLMRKQTILEEIFNGISHGIAAILSIIGLVFLVNKSALLGKTRYIVSSSIYGTSLIILYLASTLYHSIKHEKAKRILRVLDHSSIFLLIAGTYTPFCLITLQGVWGWSLFAVLWGLTLIGLTLKVIPIPKFKNASVAIYLIMGWMVVVAAKPLINNFCFSGLMWLSAGGLFYTIGTIFYKLKHIKFMHVVWHFFVMAASLCHFLAILFYVISE
jgi:hemolysin III